MITDGLRAYDFSQAGYQNVRPLAVFVRDPQTGKVVGGRVLAMAEEEGRRRGCTRIALTTLSIEAPGFYKGYEVAATIDCDPPGLTRYYMMKRL